MDEMKTDVYSTKQPNNYPLYRQVESVHGIYLQGHVQGEIGQLDLFHLILVLTTSATMIGAWVFVMDKVMIYLLKESDIYESYKFQHYEWGAEISGG